MSAIRDRLMASIKIDAINGDAFERSVVRRQILEGIAHIDEQSGQIATLKSALISHVAQEKIAQMGRFGFVLDSTVCNPYGDARKQLAREYPEIFKEMKE